MPIVVRDAFHEGSWSMRATLLGRKPRAADRAPAVGGRIEYELA